jgi:hypothetical protein
MAIHDMEQAGAEKESGKKGHLWIGFPDRS